MPAPSVPLPRALAVFDVGENMPNTYSLGSMVDFRYQSVLIAFDIENCPLVHRIGG
jgi:hypothetical protein